MDPKEFAYWLQGYFEIEDPKTLDKKQVQIIKDHLDLVFKKVTPSRRVKIKSDFTKKVDKEKLMEDVQNLFTPRPPSTLYCISNKKIC